MSPLRSNSSRRLSNVVGGWCRSLDEGRRTTHTSANCTDVLHHRNRSHEHLLACLLLRPAAAVYVPMRGLVSGSAYTGIEAMKKRSAQSIQKTAETLEDVIRMA